MIVISHFSVLLQSLEIFKWVNRYELRSTTGGFTLNYQFWNSAIGNRYTDTQTAAQVHVGILQKQLSFVGMSRLDKAYNSCSLSSWLCLSTPMDVMTLNCHKTAFTAIKSQMEITAISTLPLPLINMQVSCLLSTNNLLNSFHILSINCELTVYQGHPRQKLHVWDLWINKLRLHVQINTCKL